MSHSTDPSNEDLPVIERIALGLHAEAQKITKENDYRVDVAEVVRPRALNRYTPRDGLIVLQQDNPVPDDTELLEGNAPMVVWIQPFAFDIFVRPSDRSHVPIDTRINLYTSELRRCLAAALAHGADNEWWHLAYNWRFDTPVRFAEGDFEGAQQMLEITYRVSEDDPYQQR